MVAKFRITPLNLHDRATVTCSVTPSTGYEPTNTQNRIRDQVFKSADGTAQTISGTFADDHSASFFGLFRHTAHGGSIQLKLFSDAAWSSSVYDSGALPASNITPTETYDWGLLDNDPFVGEYPYWLDFTETTFKSYRIYFSGTPTAAYWQVSRIWLGLSYEVGINMNHGATIGMAGQTDRNRSRGGSIRTSAGETWRVMGLDFGLIEEADRAMWLDIMRYCGMTRDVVVSWFPGEGGRLERDHIMNGIFTSLDAIGRQVSWLTKRLQLEEV